MIWYEIKCAICADLLLRRLKQPERRLSALNSIEKRLLEIWPDFLSNPKVLLDVGKEAVSKKLDGLAKTRRLNDAEKSVLKQIFEQLKATSGNSSAARRSSELHLPAASSQRPTSEIARDRKMNVKLGLPPVIRKSSTILILGTMPGDESLRLQRYYAHVTNQFWRILTEVYGETIGSDYSEQLKFLHDRGLALWDVLRSAEREGSSDSRIKKNVANDFANLLKTYTGIKVIAFNGRNAEKFFRRYVDKLSISVASSSVRKVFLPSSSGTPGRNVPSFQQKVVCWRSLASL